MHRLLCLWLALALAATAAGERQQVRISARFVAMPHPVLTELMASPDPRGHLIHQLAMERVAKSKATILDQSMVVCRPNQKATLASVLEFIYVTECEMTEFFGSYLSKRDMPKFKGGPRFLTAWDTRNTGLTLEVEPSLSPNAGFINLRLCLDSVALVRLDTRKEHRDSRGEASIRMPVFEALRSNTTLDLAPGRFELAAILTPKPTAPGPALGKKVMLFLRADLITLPSNR